MKNKTSILECSRVIATICILLFHYDSAIENKYYWSGYLAVDFFYMLAGYCMMFSFDKIYTSTQDTCIKIIEYGKKRISRLYPHYLFSFVLMIIYFISINHWSLKESWHFINEYKWELTFLERIINPNCSILNHPTWFLMWLIICSCIALLLCLKIKNYRKNLSLYFGILCYLVLIFYQGIINGQLYILRGLGAISIGIYSFYSSQTENKIFRLKTIYYILGLLLGTLFVLYAMFYNPYMTYDDLIGIIGNAILIYILPKIPQRFSDNKLLYHFGKLGKYSYACYLNHVLIICIFLTINHTYPKWILFIIYIITTFILSFISTKLVSIITNFYFKLTERISFYE